MYKCINGWTKKKMIAAIRKYNNGTKSQVAKGRQCLYKAPDGNRCAVGCFIPNSETAAFQSYMSAPALLNTHPQLYEAMPLETFAMCLLQVVHDRAPGRVRRRLINWINENVEG